MRNWTIAFCASAVCVCCVLPSYEGSDRQPGRGGGGASSGDAGRGTTTDAKGGDAAGGDGGDHSGIDSGGIAGTTSGGTTNTAGTAGTAGTTNTVGSGGVSGTAGVAGQNGGDGAAEGGGGAVTGEVTCPANVLGHCAAGETYAAHPGYTLALVEDFTVPLDLNDDPIWTWSDGAPADGQTAMREENISFVDGQLVITAAPPAGCAAKTTNAGCIAPHSSYAEAQDNKTQATIGAMGVWSGELRSKYNNYRYGRYEAKLKAPVANPGQEATGNMSGNFLATLFTFRSPKNIKWAEIDVQLSPWHSTQVSGNVVSATFAGGTAVGYPAGNAAPFDFSPAGGYTIYQEHVYAFNWTASKIEWFVDGVSVKEFTGTAQVPIPSVSAKVMMNLWVFSGSTFGDGATNKFPFSVSYDYFHFYKLDTEPTYPCSPTPACLPAADRTKSAQNNPKEPSYGQ